MRKPDTTEEHQQAVSYGILPEENVRAWAEIETGRYQPRRVKGSFVAIRFGDNSKSVDGAQHSDECLAHLRRLHRYQHCRISPLTSRRFVRRAATNQ